MFVIMYAISLQEIHIMLYSKQVMLLSDMHVIGVDKSY